MEELPELDYNPDLDLIEDEIIGELETHDQILRNAHKLLLPNNRYSYDLVNDVN